MTKNSHEQPDVNKTYARKLYRYNLNILKKSHLFKDHLNNCEGQDAPYKRRKPKICAVCM